MAQDPDQCHNLKSNPLRTKPYPNLMGIPNIKPSPNLRTNQNLKKSPSPNQRFSLSPKLYSAPI